MKLNKEWHQAHRMPGKATLEQRIAWHKAHLKNCQCRTDIPEKVKAEMEKNGIKINRARLNLLLKVNGVLCVATVAFTIIDIT